MKRAKVGSSGRMADNQDRYLKQLAHVGYDLSLTKRSKLPGFPSDATIRKWRRDPSFRALEDAVTERALAAKAERHTTRRSRKVNPKGLSEKQVEWLEHFEVCQDRVGACEMAAVSVVDVDDWQSEPAFKREWRRIELERVWAARDALARSSAGGNVSAAKSVLAELDPGYGRKLPTDPSKANGQVPSIRPGQYQERKESLDDWLAEKQQASSSS